MKGFFVTGIGTEIGKTVVSAMLVSGLQSDYWKPIQAGNLDYTDSMTVASFIDKNSRSVIHKESYLLQYPLSPHAAAAKQNIVISPETIIQPNTENLVIVEGAGGVMVPLAKQFLIVDLIKQLGLPVIVVSPFYLGSINHTLLTVHLLQHCSVPIKGIVFNGEVVPSTKEFILEYTGLSCIGVVQRYPALTSEIIRENGNLLAANL